MNKDQLIRETARRTGVSEALAGRVLASFMDAAFEALLYKDRIVIANFGVLRPVLRSKRTAVNPLSKAVYAIPPRWDVKFLPSAYLKAAINDTGLKGQEDTRPVEIVVPEPERRRSSNA